jgi:NADPH:quinone reductase-like Zn-dependent oxidoreductase
MDGDQTECWLMQAMTISTFGSPDVLRLVDVDDPQAGAGQVRVRAKTAGVQPIDTRVRRGWAPTGAAVSLPQILGNEFSGIVDEVGEGVTGVSVGDEGLGFATMGCYAELVVVGADQVAAKPRDMPWEVAGGLSGAGQAAHNALKVLGVGNGNTVLIHAAAGGVGTVAVQLARDWGATVIGTASAGNHDYLRSLGAIPVTYGDGLVDQVRALAPDGVDAALDAAGADALRASLELVKDKQRKTPPNVTSAANAPAGHSPLGFIPPTDMGKTEIYEPTETVWRRHVLAPGVELHVRDTDAPKLAAAIERLIRQADEILDQDEP